MKLVVIQLILFVILAIMAATGNIQYGYIPVTLMIIPATLLCGLACNWPIIGLWAVKFEWPGKVGCFLYDQKLTVDNNYTAWEYQTIRVMHTRKYGKYYKTWYLNLGPSHIHPITSII